MAPRGWVGTKLRKNTLLKLQSMGKTFTSGYSLLLKKHNSLEGMRKVNTCFILIMAYNDDRCHRIGQRDAVTAWFLVAAGTIEEEIAALLDSKRRQLDAVLDGQITDETTLLTALLEKYRSFSENNYK